METVTIQIPETALKLAADIAVLMAAKNRRNYSTADALRCAIIRGLNGMGETYPKLPEAS